MRFPDSLLLVSLRSRLRAMTGRQDALIASLALVAIVAGGVLDLSGRGTAAIAVWAFAIVVAIVPLTWSVARSLLRKDVGVDVVALLAMAGALALDEFLAGAVIALMLTGSNALKVAAGRRPARRKRSEDARASRLRHAGVVL